MALPKEKPQRVRNLADLYERDSKTGRLLRRAEGPWSSYGDQCAGCGRSDARHEARGLCRKCYVKWRYHVDPEHQERLKAKNKLRRLKTDSDALRYEKRKDTPEYKAMHKLASRRYAAKHAKWPIGSRVSYLWIQGVPRIQGVIVDKNRYKAKVEFATFYRWITYRDLQMVDRAEVAC